MIKVQGTRMMLSVYLAPRSKRAGIVGKHGDALKIAVAAPPIEGRANEALTEFLADICSLPRGAVQVVRGATNRNKLVALEFKDAAALELAIKRLSAATS